MLLRKETIAMPSRTGDQSRRPLVRPAEAKWKKESPERGATGLPLDRCRFYSELTSGSYNSLLP